MCLGQLREEKWSVSNSDLPPSLSLSPSLPWDDGSPAKTDSPGSMLSPHRGCIQYSLFGLGFVPWFRPRSKTDGAGGMKSVRAIRKIGNREQRKSSGEGREDQRPQISKETNSRVNKGVVESRSLIQFGLPARLASANRKAALTDGRRAQLVARVGELHGPLVVKLPNMAFIWGTKRGIFG